MVVNPAITIFFYTFERRYNKLDNIFMLSEGSPRGGYSLPDCHGSSIYDEIHNKKKNKKNDDDDWFTILMKIIISILLIGGTIYTVAFVFKRIVSQ